LAGLSVHTFVCYSYGNIIFDIRLFYLRSLFSGTQLERTTRCVTARNSNDLIQSFK